MDKQTYYHLLITGQLEEGLTEPNDFEFIMHDERTGGKKKWQTTKKQSKLS
jgi:hypothetical protein